MLERLQTILSHAGVASRRHAAVLIEEGRVTVDGAVVTEPGARVDPASARVVFDGRPVNVRERVRTIVLYKPAGVLSTMSDPFGGRTVADLVRGKVAERLVPVGRLDKESEGLLLMSNDGNLTLRLTHPRFAHVKTYVVRVSGDWDERTLRVLRGPVAMPDGYVTRPADVRVLDGPRRGEATLEFRLGEGRKRQIRHLCAAAGLRVVSLVRTAIGNFKLPPSLTPGTWRDLTPRERSLVFGTVGTDPTSPWGQTPGRSCES
jgi:pseudouridine synthase